MPLKKYYVLIVTASLAMRPSMSLGSDASLDRATLKGLALAQGSTQSSVPSKEEVSELASKANQKASAFEEAVKIAKPWLDKIDPKLPTNYLNGASAAHTISLGIQQNGPSAYRLVSLLATLDDLSLDGANAGAQLFAADEMNVMKGAQPDGSALVAITGLMSAGSACNDIAELILHATLRFIRAEEDVLEKLSGKQE